MRVFQGKEEGAGAVKHDIPRWWGVRTLYGEAPKDGAGREGQGGRRLQVGRTSTDQRSTAGRGPETDRSQCTSMVASVSVVPALYPARGVDELI